MNFKSEVLNELKERGFIAQGIHLEDLDALLEKETITAYVGCDATAASLHVGNLVSLMLCRWLQYFGHKVLMLVGGGTTKIGDPSGRDTTRRMLSEETIQENISGILHNMKSILHFEGPNPAQSVNNADWLDTLSYIPFLREIGVHFSVNRMLSFENVKNRLDREQNLSFIEFNYMLLQSYDFLQLYREYGCRLQLGGSDQWGNIVCGVDLIRRITGEKVFGLTTPLTTTARGKKMGKTAEGAVWLDKDLFSPYEYWQFWRSVDDEDVGRFLRLYTVLPLAEITRLESLEGQEINDAKIILADAATALLHGTECLSSIHSTVSRVFMGYAGVEEDVDLPRYYISSEENTQGVLIPNILKDLGFCRSSTEGRQKIREGAVFVDHQPWCEEGRPLFLKDGQRVYLSLGKKKHAFIEIS